MKKIISILLITTMLFCQLIVYAAEGTQKNTITFKELINIELKDIAEISIRSGTTGEGVIITSQPIIEDILKHINNMELKEYKDTVGGSRGGWAYSIMFGLSNNSSIHYTCSTGTEINNVKYEAVDDTEVRKCLEHYYNLYKSINSSEWATDTIAEAVLLGIINEDNSWNFPSSICREDFCNIAVKMIESAGVILPTENPQRPLGIKDTDNINVLKLYKAGVISGKEQHKTGVTFAPSDFITREEAATILYRIIRYCFWFDMPQSAYNESVSFYSDKDMISDWAFEAVFYLKELGIMLGTSDNEFSPKGSYTVEQTVATMVRLFKLANQYGNKTLKEIFFYVPSIEKTSVEKQDDGWYKFPEKVVALFPFPSFDYEKPISVTAIFTPTGTETNIMAKEIAKIEPPYMYETMAEVLNMEISLPSDATRGHLFFRFEFEDGSVEDSQYFNVYQE